MGNRKVEVGKVESGINDKDETGKKVRKDKLILTDNQKQFVENYLFNQGNATRAYAMAYRNKNENTCAAKGSALLKMDKIKNEIDSRRAEIKEQNLDHIASGNEVLQFFTQVMTNPENPMTHRIKAAEMIGKAEGLWIERHEINVETDYQINLGFTEEDTRKELNNVIDAEVNLIELEEEIEEVEK